MACARELAHGLQNAGVASSAITAAMPTGLVPAPNFYVDLWRNLAPAPDQTAKSAEGGAQAAEGAQSRAQVSAALPVSAV